MNGFKLTLKVTPKARGEGIAAIAEGVVKIKVRAAPERGKANEAVRTVLARAFDVPASRVRILAGETGRDKIALIEGDKAALETRLALLTQSLKESPP